MTDRESWHRGLTVSGASRPFARKPYRRPCLIAYGDLRTLTLGGSPGMGDSGSTVMIRKPPAP